MTLPSTHFFSMLNIKPVKTKGADGAGDFQAVLEPMTTQPNFYHNDVLCPSWDLDSALYLKPVALGMRTAGPVSTEGNRAMSLS